jgi:hypothetical protein
VHDEAIAVDIPKSLFNTGESVINKTQTYNDYEPPANIRTENISSLHKLYGSVNSKDNRASTSPSKSIQNINKNHDNKNTDQTMTRAQSVSNFTDDSESSQIDLMKNILLTNGGGMDRDK